MQIQEQVHDQMQDLRPLFTMHAELCKALANPYRLAMLYALKQGEMSVGELAQTVDISIHNASQHLRLLQERMLVRSRKQGQTVFYSITDPKFIQACTLIRQALIEQHQAAGESLLPANVIEQLLAAPTETYSRDT
jgi:DNA-binding transcriptional ArsR family regulator